MGKMLEMLQKRSQVEHWFFEQLFATTAKDVRRPHERGCARAVKALEEQIASVGSNCKCQPCQTKESICLLQNCLECTHSCQFTCLPPASSSGREELLVGRVACFQFFQ